MIQIGRLRLWAGRDDSFLLPASLGILWMRPDAHKVPRGERLDLWSVQLSWEWLPRFLRVYEGSPRYWNCVDASAWTGRYWRIFAIRWEVVFQAKLFGRRFYVST